MKLTVSCTLNLPLNRVWELWTTPKHIKLWNQASTEWHTTQASNNLMVGGAFNYHMAAKDGSFGFDFSGKYTSIDLEKKICYTLDDHREVEIVFEQINNQTQITQQFEAETENTPDLQQAGWQAILNSFKKYSETYEHENK